MPDSITRQVPAAALRFDAGPFTFAEAAGDDAETYPVELLARTGQPVEHWLWGRVVHDLKGCQHKERVAIDWAHREDSVLGYVDRFDTADGNLRLGGELVPYGPDDRVHELVHKGRKGCPYEASIDFRGEGIIAEEVGSGAKAEVNGYEIDGPALIFRQWPLRSVAICKAAQDAGTEATFSADDNDTVPITIRSKRQATMTDTTNTSDQAAADKRTLWGAFCRLFGLDPATAPPDKAAPDPPAAPAPAKPEEPENATSTDSPAGALSTPPAAPPQGGDSGKRFLDAFGDKGARWFLEGKTFDEAAVLALAEARDERDELKTRLAQVDRGDTEPAEFQDAEESEAAKRTKLFASRVGGRLAPFAASIQLPKRRGSNGSA